MTFSTPLGPAAPSESPATPRWGGALELAIAFALLAVFALWLFRPLPAFIGSKTFGFNGDIVLNAYILAWGQNALAHAPLSAFHANFMFPTPNTLAISENMLAVAALTMPLAPLRNPILVYNAAVLLSFVLCGWLWFWVLRRWGLGRIAALAGGFAFAFTPWRVGQLNHMQLLMSWWSPLALVGAEAWLRTASRQGAALAAFALAGTFYSCVYNAYYTGLFVLVFLIVGAVLIRPRPARWPELLRAAFPALVLLIVLLAPAVPAYRSMHAILGEVNPEELIERRGASPSDYLRGTGYEYLGRSWIIKASNPHSDVPWENLLYLGLAPWMLAAALPFGLWLLRRRGVPVPRELAAVTWMLAAAGGFSFVLSLGPRLHLNGKLTDIDLPYAFLYKHLPGFSATRVPPRAAQFVALALSGLAAISIHAWSNVLALRFKPSVGHWVAAAGFLLLFVELPGGPLGVSDNADFTRHTAVHRALATRRSGASLTMPLADELNYLVPLATVPHFGPTPNGVSGHLPGGQGLIFDRLREEPWGASQAELLTWLGIRYLIVDEPLFAQKADREPMGTTLSRLGIAFSEEHFEAEHITLYTLLDALDTTPAERAARPDPDWSHTLTWKSPKKVEVYAWLRNKGPSVYLPGGSAVMQVDVKGLDAAGKTIWRHGYDRTLPPFLPNGYAIGFNASPKKAEVAKTHSVKMSLKCPELGISKKTVVELRPTEAMPEAPKPEAQ